MKLEAANFEAYLTQRFGGAAQVVALQALGDGAISAGTTVAGRTQRLKTYGYGQPLLVCYRIAGEERRAAFQTVAPNPFGHERRADRAANLLLSYDTFNTLPQHVHALDVGMLTPDRGPVSLGDGDEFFLLTEYAGGTAYAHDLQRLRDTGELTDLDVCRARRLAAYLAEIHAVKGSDPALYQRHIRDLLGSGEGVMGLTDSYGPDFSLVDANWLEQVEQAAVRWRWRLKAQPHRLAQIHGDFHPFNLLFGDDTDFWLLDRSRGGWGEPGDDVSCMAINYVFFSLQRSGALAPPFEQLWDVFWSTYLERTSDRDILAVVAPFFTWRALVLASPLWYNIPDTVRQALFRFIENVLDAPVFDPAQINAYLGG